ncbi:MAG: hypothetical protein K2P57_04860 [Burkholderiales bacterium]|nr:hypothetical protein [Burkholderiales bacterium]
MIATATYIVISLEMKKHDEEATLALEKRYKTLEQRNLALEMKYKKMTRKPAASQPVAIEARTPAPPIAPASIAATSAPASIAATSAPASIAATSAPANVTAVSPSKPDLAADCTAISDKASAGDVLKRCIDAFNAASRH